MRTYKKYSICAVIYNNGQYKYIIIGKFLLILHAVFYCLLFALSNNNYFNTISLGVGFISKVHIFFIYFESESFILNFAMFFSVFDHFVSFMDIYTYLII